jgi:hypothetical protein
MIISRENCLQLDLSHPFIFVAIGYEIKKKKHLMVRISTELPYSKKWSQNRYTSIKNLRENM